MEKFMSQKTKTELVGNRDYLIVAICKKKCPRYFEVHLKFFEVLRNSCVFIPPFLVEPLTTCATLWFREAFVGKHWCENSIALLLDR